MKSLIRTLLIAFLFVCFAPTVSAQETAWRELRTSKFAILYTTDDAATAQTYTGFVDGIYDEITAIFGHQTATPVTLRLYPTLESYWQVNPLARGLTGIVAHADFQRHEVVVVLPQTQNQTPDEVQNNIRHELTHIIVSDLSNDRANVLFQEGTAQYVEHPSRELETKIQLLEQARSSDQLYRWSDLDSRDTFYRNAQITYPQSLSISAFLIERFSFADYRAFLEVQATAGGYRSAIEQAFGTSATGLEDEWRAWLPGYIGGGYTRNALQRYDLAPVRQMITDGRYADAQQEIEGVLTWLQTSGQEDVLREAQTLLDATGKGQRADALAQQARDALAGYRYDEAAGLVVQAQDLYASVGDTRQTDILADYAQRAARGQAAAQTLQQASSLTRTLRYPEARALADRAAAEYGAIGDSIGVEQARAFRAELDWRQRLAGGVLLVLGALGVGGSVWRRIRWQEAEAW